MNTNALPPSGFGFLVMRLICLAVFLDTCHLVVVVPLS